MDEFKAKFLSLFESIIYYNVDQKQMYNKALYRVILRKKNFILLYKMFLIIFKRKNYYFYILIC